MEERHEIVGLARRVGGEGFGDIEPEELDDLIASHAFELTVEELDAMSKVSEGEEEEEEDEEVGSDKEEEVSRPNLTIKFVGEMQDMWSMTEATRC